MTQAQPSVILQIQPHKQMTGLAVGAWLDLSDIVMTARRTYDMGVGSFTAQLKATLDSYEKRMIETYVREGDPIAIRMSNDPSITGKLFYGFIDSVGRSKAIDPATRAQTFTFTISGRGWGRALQTPILSGTALRGKRVAKVPLVSGSSVREGEPTPQLPGMITADVWVKIMSAVWRPAFQSNGSGAQKALKRLLQITMNDTWKNPLGEALIDRLSWGQFGNGVKGIPWRIIELTMGGNMLTPDTILRQIGNESYNEVIYDYDYDNEEKPAIIYRPRPYEAKNKASVDSFEVPLEQITGGETTRTGAERFNYYRSNAALMSFNGIEIGIDRAGFKSPVIDRDSVERHGLRPIMPQDDFFPPLNANADLLKYYIQRINKYYGWYANNAEMISGTVTCKGVIPKAAIGKYVILPEAYFWDDGGYSDKIKGYCVALTETFRVSPVTRAVTMDSAIAFIRGETPASLAVAEAEPWGDPAAVTVEPASDVDRSIYVTSNGMIKWSEIYQKAQYGQQRLNCPDVYKANMIEICSIVEKVAQAMGVSTILITSSYRTYDYDKAMWAAQHPSEPWSDKKTSPHWYGKALDVQFVGQTAAAVQAKFAAMRAAGEIRAGGLGTYPTFTHYDVGPNRLWSSSPDDN